MTQTLRELFDLICEYPWVSLLLLYIANNLLTNIFKCICLLIAAIFGSKDDPPTNKPKEQ